MIEVNPSDFTQALNRVMAAVERNKENPVVGHVLLTTVEGKVILRATDYVVEITTEIECQGEMDPAVVPADRLHNAFARLTERGLARLALQKDAMVITSGRARFSLPLLEPATNFPTIEGNEPGATFNIEGKALSGLIETCAFAAANKDGRMPIVEGLHIFSGGMRAGVTGYLCAVATDRYKLMVRQIPCDLPEDMPEVTVPLRCADKLSKMVRDWSEVHMELSERRLVATFGPTRFVSRFLEGIYPDWRRLMPKVDPSVSYDADALSEAIGNTYAAVRADKKYNAMEVRFDEAETSFDIRNADGTASGSDACHHSLVAAEKPSMVYGCNPAYFVDIISHLGAETIQLTLQDGNSPMLLSCPNLDDRLALLMPVRLAVIEQGDEA